MLGICGHQATDLYEMVSQPLTPFSELRGRFALSAASPKIIPLSTLGLGSI